MKNKPRLDHYVELLDTIDYQARLIQRQNATINSLTLKILEQEAIISELTHAGGQVVELDGTR